MKWYIGCSGFSYKEWKGVFYPDKLTASKWLGFYATHFTTLELNTTFYRFPTVKRMNEWYAKSPDNFSFACKVPKLITHFKQMNGVQELLADFYTACKDGLKEKLGPVLFQFPPKYSFTPERLQQLIASVDRDFVNVVEFRHASWWNEEVYTQLKNHKIVFCGISYPGLPDEPVCNGPIMYYRFHGIPKLYYSGYEEQALKAFAESALNEHSVKKVYCYFNNTASVEAIKNAELLAEFAAAKRDKK